MAVNPTITYNPTFSSPTPPHLIDSIAITFIATIIIILMILVLVILGGLLVGRMNMSTQVSKRPTREMRAEKELHALRIALERFREDCGRYPTVEEGLRALVLNPGGVTNWGGHRGRHYVNIVKPDPWRMPYVYTVTNTAVVLFSRGADTRPNTPDDLHPEPPTPEEVRRSHP